MNEYDSIRARATSITSEQMRLYFAEGCKGVHESVLRSWSILQKVKWLLEKKTAPEVIIELIALMENLSREVES